MLNEQEYDAYCQTQDVGMHGKVYIDRMRKSGSVRDVSANRSHGAVRYASTKMSRTIMCESRTLEAPHTVKDECDTNVIEIHEQPDLCKLPNLKPSDRKLPSITHYPDRLLLCHDGIKVVEYKLSKALEKLVETKPWQFTFDKDTSRYRNLAAEQYYAEYDIEYIIKTELDLDKIEVANLDVITPYFSNKYTIPTEAKRAIKALIKHEFTENSGATIAELLIHPHISIDDIYKGLANGFLKADFKFRPITEHESFRIFLDNKNVERFKKRREELTQSDREEIAHSPDLEILLRASDADIEEARRRLNILQDYKLTGQRPDNIKKSTFYDYRKLYKEGDRLYGNGFLGLIPRNSYSGPQGSTLPPAYMELLLELKASEFDSDKNITNKAKYTKFITTLTNKGLPPIHESTFRKLLIANETIDSIKKKKGHKIASTEAPPVWGNEFDEFKKGLFPDHVCHMDHTQLNLWVRGGYFPGILAKPWITTIIDTYSKDLRAYYISLMHPSSVNGQIALRRFIKRHGRVMRYLVLDGGSDFNSEAVETLLAFYNISKIERRTSQPKDGPEVERFNLTIDEDVLKNLQANNQQLQMPRSMDNKLDPRNQAIWTMQALEPLLELYFEKYYRAVKHDSMGCSPNEKLAAGEALIGKHTHRQVINLEQLKLLTCSKGRSNKGHAKATRHGIRIAHAYYGPETFAAYKHRGNKYPVLWDAEDIRHGYAQPNKKWQRYSSRFLGAFQNLAPNEICAASHEYRYLMSKSGHDGMSELRLYQEFLNHIEAEEELLSEQVESLNADKKRREQTPSRAVKDVPNSLGIPRGKRKVLEVIRD